MGRSQCGGDGADSGSFRDAAERGRAIGVNDSFAGGVSMLTAVITGPLVEWGGLPWAGATAVLLAAVPLVMRAVSRTNR